MSEEVKSPPKKLEEETLESKREDFIETFFRKGAEFTSSLLGEVQSLQAEIERLRHENAEFRHHLASEGAIRELLVKIERLESDKERLRSHAKSEEERKDDYAEKYAEVERELDTMANLYVALSQLHSKFEPQEMLGVIEQFLAQFVGVGSFIIYLKCIEDGATILAPVHAYHCEHGGETVAWNEGPVGKTAAKQMNYVAENTVRDTGTPLACIPMVFGADTVGVISIVNFFEQKTKFEDIDFEFFKLLAVHSASAIVAAGLMANAKDIDTGLRQYRRL